MQHRAVETTAEYLGRFETGRDWRTQLEELAAEVDAEAAWFTAMGAVQDAELWYYDQDDKEYMPITVETPHEVAACVGNISRLDGELFAHTHAVLSGPDGETIAGHLEAGETFAGEVHMRVFDTELVRSYDEPTELDLWL
ncbi:MAG: PPC domain-containing DNA-binding protein [Salinarchaeum sp.]